MGTIRRQLLLSCLKLFDVVLMVCCFLLASFCVMRQDGSVSFEQFIAMRVSLVNLVWFSIFLGAWHATFAAFGLYSSRRLMRRGADFADILKAASAGTLLILLAGATFRFRLISPFFLVVFWTAAIVITTLTRLFLRSLLERVRVHGRNLRYMLIVGTNARAVEFAHGIAAKPELGYRVIGFVDQDWQRIQEFHVSGFSLVCDFSKLGSFLRDSVVDEVVIALPMGSLHTSAAQIATLCEEQGITTRVLPSIFDLKLARAKAEKLEGASLITHYTGLAEEWPVLVKRFVDIVVSLALVVICAPVMLLAALLIKLTSPGPVLFTQKRLGLNKRQFNVYKFRTMVPDAEQKIRGLEHLNEASGPVFKIKNDPRVTRIGKQLRKTSIDELPQLFNVLKGEMSLVGPRPLPIRDYQGFSQDWQRRRFSVPPGITCLWQITGRSSIPFEKWMQLDLQYIDKWSLWLDFEILARTIPAVLKGSGAT